MDHQSDIENKIIFFDIFSFFMSIPNGTMRKPLKILVVSRTKDPYERISENEEHSSIFITLRYILNYKYQQNYFLEGF